MDLGNGLKQNAANSDSALNWRLIAISPIKPEILVVSEIV